MPRRARKAIRKLYKYEIIETLSNVFLVEARNQEEADRIIEEAYSDTGEAVLTVEKDYKGGEILYRGVFRDDNPEDYQILFNRPKESEE